VFPHFVSQCTVGFLYDANASQPSLSLKGGAHSDIQTLIVVVNFFMGTVVANFFNMRENALAAPEVAGTGVLAKFASTASKLSTASKDSDKRAASPKSLADVVLQDAGTQTVMSGHVDFGTDVRSV